MNVLCIRPNDIINHSISSWHVVVCIHTYINFSSYIVVQRGFLVLQTRGQITSKIGNNNNNNNNKCFSRVSLVPQTRGLMSLKIYNYYFNHKENILRVPFGDCTKRSKMLYNPIWGDAFLDHGNNLPRVSNNPQAIYTSNL